jgi:hypothetical protein
MTTATPAGEGGGVGRSTGTDGKAVLKAMGMNKSLL